jgi:hypothetical protein
METREKKSRKIKERFGRLERKVNRRTFKFIRNGEI